MAAAIAERAKLQAVLAYWKAGGEEGGRLAYMTLYARFWLAELEARLSPTSLDISARSQKPQFAELIETEADRWDAYGATAPGLRLWAIDQEKELARRSSSADWAADGGYLKAPQPAAKGD